MRIYKKAGLAVVLGLVAGLALAGVATAVPAVAATTDRLGATPRVDWQSMLDFMGKYRAPDGTIDMYRMMGDVQTGKVTPPCGGPDAVGATGRYGTGTAPRTARTPGFGQMMGGYGGGYGGGMMGGYPTF